MLEELFFFPFSAIEIFRHSRKQRKNLLSVEKFSKAFLLLGYARLCVAHSVLSSSLTVRRVLFVFACVNVFSLWKWNLIVVRLFFQAGCFHNVRMQLVSLFNIVVLKYIIVLSFCSNIIIIWIKIYIFLLKIQNNIYRRNKELNEEIYIVYTASVIFQLYLAYSVRDLLLLI